MSAVRIGVIGLGNIGQQHAKLLAGGEIAGAELGAVCARASDFDAPCFEDHDALLQSGLVDAVLIATPTMSHPQMGHPTLEAGLHLLMEKPLAMSIGQARDLVLSAPSGVQFAVMLNQRFHSAYRRIKHLLDEGRIGLLKRFAWNMTAWYRPDVYYKVSRWRGTWPGEGGGLLINQCIHNLDVLQWLVGMPDSVYAIAGFGKYHEIHVEDEVTATLQFQDGLTGTITASSGEAPGINQLDLVGDRGTIRYDGEQIRLYEAGMSVAEHCAHTLDMFGMPAFSEHLIGPEQRVNQHGAVLQNFVNAIGEDEPLETPASAGLNSIELANAMLFSAWRGEAVSLPLDAEAYETALYQRIEASSLREPAALEANIDMEKSYR